MRLCLVYVLMNRRKHCAGELGPTPVVRARSWLAAVGWRRYGLIACDEQPRGA